MHRIIFTHINIYSAVRVYVGQRPGQEGEHVAAAREHLQARQPLGVLGQVGQTVLPGGIIVLSVIWTLNKGIV